MGFVDSNSIPSNFIDRYQTHQSEQMLLSTEAHVHILTFSDAYNSYESNIKWLSLWAEA